MSEYTVYIKSYYIVEAKDEGEAEDKALEELQKDINKGSVHTYVQEEQK